MRLKGASLLLFLVLQLCLAQGNDPFNINDYIDVYPDPTDPEVLQGRTPLFFSMIPSLGGTLVQFDGSGGVAGVQVALDWINNDTSLLPGYTLHYTLTDSEVGLLLVGIALLTAHSTTYMYTHSCMPTVLLIAAAFCLKYPAVLLMSCKIVSCILIKYRQDHVTHKIMQNDKI